MIKKSETTETKTFERIKLFEESKLIDYDIECRKKAIGHIEAFRQALADEGVILTNEILDKYIQGGYPIISRILLDSAKERLKKLKVGSLVLESLESDALRIAKLQFDSYQQPIQKALADCGISAYEIAFEKGIPVLTEEQELQIRESWTVYLKTIEDKELHSNLQAFTKVYQELDNYLREKGILPKLSDCLITALANNAFILSEIGIPPELRPDTFLMTGENDQLVINPKYWMK